jgi:predicted HAD superfamily Cof-like phosphohydrolase
MTTNHRKRIDFAVAMDGGAFSRPTVPAPQTAELALLLIREEAEEVMEAWELLNEDGYPADPMQLAPLAHELADLLYVTYGALVAMGIDADAVFAEVHRANMQKAGGERRPDGKVLKPPGFVRADVARVLRELSTRPAALAGDGSEYGWIDTLSESEAKQGVPFNP